MVTDMTSNGPVKMNDTMTITISLEKLGTGTCLWVDLGDNSPLFLFGNYSCPGQIDVDSINPNIGAESNYTFKHPNTEQIIINHVYPHFGSHVIKMGASNIVSTAALEMVAVVLPFECRNPNVTIKGKNFVTQS